MRARAVVVEDEYVIREDLKQILQEYDYEVVGEASTVKEAVEVVNGVMPDVVLLDIKLPDGDGFDAVRCFLPDLAVIVITAYANREFIQRAKDVGVYAYLVKPFRKEDVYAAVEVAMNNSRRVKEMEGKLRKRKLVERAKGILMEKMSVTEREAYRYLQKVSMDTGVPMDELSARIVKKYG